MEKEEFKQMLIDVIHDEVNRFGYSELTEMIHRAYQHAQDEHDSAEARAWT